MSTVKATNLQHASSSSVNAVTTSGGDLTNAAGVSFMGGSKNLLYNGAMQVAQRGTLTSGITTSGRYTADRWIFDPATMGTWTQSVESANGPAGSGLIKSLKLTCTTADAAPAAGDFVLFQQALEGQDLQRIAKGSASAQQLTLSFWVQSNVTGTYIVELDDYDNTRKISASYTISASGTWEKKTITFAADTTGAFDNDNAASLFVRWWLGAGTTWTSGTLNTSWTASTASANRAVGQTNLAAATNNYWQVTGTQLEIGPVATSFEFKSYGQELRECQRYYYRIQPGASGRLLGVGYSAGAGTHYSYIKLPSMRTRPTALEQSGTASHYAVIQQDTVTACNLVPTYGNATNEEAAFTTFTVASVLTAGQGSAGYTNNAAAYLAWSAEL